MSLQSDWNQGRSWRWIDRRKKHTATETDSDTLDEVDEQDLEQFNEDFEAAMMEYNTHESGSNSTRPVRKAKKDAINKIHALYKSNRSVKRCCKA